MTIDRLDVVLERARESEPDDDGFTEIVMQGIRTGGRTRATRRRFVTRPVILATAAVLATGGALAAAVRTNTLNPAHHATPAPARAAAPTRPAAPASTTSKTTAPSVTGSTGIVVAAPKPPTAPLVRRFKSGYLEWGYTSAHTAYVLDKRSGLRVVTELGKTPTAGRIGDVKVTVTNTTKETVAVSSRSGCALSAAAWSGRVPESSSIAVTSRDPSTAKYWECAGGGSARNVGADEFILAPGESRTKTARLTVARGTWAIAGVCRCTVVSATGPREGMTLGGLQGLVITTQSGPVESRLVTPPLVVDAR